MLGVLGGIIGYYFSLYLLKRRYNLEYDWSSRDLRELRKQRSITAGTNKPVQPSGSVQLSANTGITSDECDTSKNS